MEIYKSIFLCIYIPLFNGEKIYIPDIDGATGLSYNWIVPKKSQCANSPWNYHRPSVNNRHPYYGVCSSNNCILETTTYLIKDVNVVYAEIHYVGSYC